MALKINLKPHERLIIGGAVISNGNVKSEIIVENNVPVLREKDILREKEANTPCKKVYFIIQLMYIDDKNLVEKHNIYWTLVKEVVKAAPSTVELFGEISEHILGNRYYQALKLTKKLIDYEKEAMEHAGTRTQRVQTDN
jgi:flagellar biosynthesis repressor protein FlbT